MAWFRIDWNQLAVSLPKYPLVAVRVRAQIADGTLLPGEPAPSGAALARKTGYSVLTCRQALRILIMEGVLVPGASPGARPRVPARAPRPATGTLPMPHAPCPLPRGPPPRRWPDTASARQDRRDVDYLVGHAETGRVWQSRRSGNAPTRRLSRAGTAGPVRRLPRRSRSCRTRHSGCCPRRRGFATMPQRPTSFTAAGTWPR